MNKLLLIGLVLALLTVGVAVADDNRQGVFPTHLDTCNYEIEDNTTQDNETNNQTNTTTSTPTIAKIVKTSNNNGGSWCAPSWECSAWGPCQDSGFQFRVCTDKWDCGSVEGIPSEFQACGDDKPTGTGANTLDVEPNVLSGEPIVIDITDEEPKDEGDNELTGAVVGGSSGSWIWGALVGAFILGLFGLYFAKK